MKLITLTIILILLLSNCKLKKDHSNNRDNADSLKECSIEQLKCQFGDSIISIKYKDSTIYRYKEFIVTVIPNKYNVGDTIKIFNKITTHLYIIDKGLFDGIIKGFILTDAGTGIERLETLTDLNTGKEVFNLRKITGEDSMCINDNTISFYTYTLPKEELNNRNAPSCNDSIYMTYDGGGYVLEFISFDLKTRIIKYTGKFKCS